MIQAAIALVLCMLIGLRVAASMARRPENLGLQDGQLSPCPESPNCVCSQCDSLDHQMNPWDYSGSTADAMTDLKSSISILPRTQIVEADDDYLYAESKSLLFRFVDDVEFFIDDIEKKIHFRSASRVGRSDLGVNRKRMKKLAESFQQMQASRQ